VPGARGAAGRARRAPPSSVNRLCFGECRPGRMRAGLVSCSPWSRHTLHCFLFLLTDRAPGASAVHGLGPLQCTAWAAPPSAPLRAPAAGSRAGPRNVFLQPCLPLVQSLPCWPRSASCALGDARLEVHFSGPHPGVGPVVCPSWGLLCARLRRSVVARRVLFAIRLWRPGRGDTMRTALLWQDGRGVFLGLT